MYRVSVHSDLCLRDAFPTSVASGCSDTLKKKSPREGNPRRAVGHPIRGGGYLPSEIADKPDMSDQPQNTAAAGQEQLLTEQDDDADEDRDDGAGPQASRRHGPEGGAVAVFIAGAHLHFDD